MYPNENFYIYNHLTGRNMIIFEEMGESYHTPNAPKK